MDTTLSQRPATGKVLPARLATATAWLTGLSCVAVVFSIAISQILLAVVLLSLALVGAFTRGIWLGTLAGTTYLAARYRSWMVGLIPIVVLLVYLISPAWLQRRDESIFEPRGDSSSMSRLVMLRTGLRMIRAHPFFGLGTERVGAEFHRYAPEGITRPPAWYGHLHNTYIQIAKELAIQCIIILLWLFYEVVRDNIPRARSPLAREHALGSAAIAATIGLLVAGLFEYNFGDSEVVMLYLFVIALPYAWSQRESRPASASRA